MNLQTSAQRDAIVEAMMTIRKPDHAFQYQMLQNWLRTNPEGFRGYPEGAPMPSERLGVLAAPGATQRYIEGLTGGTKSDWDVMKDDPHAFDEQRRYQTEWGVGADYE